MQKAITIRKEEWYQNLVEECRAIITEAVFTSRWALVEGHWNLGRTIREELKLRKWKQNETGRVLQGLAKDLGISERTIYYSLQAYDKYPDINKIPEGKNISWNKLITKYLPKGRENEKEQRHYMTVLIDKKEKVIWISEKYKDYKIKYRR